MRSTTLSRRAVLAFATAAALSCAAHAQSPAPVKLAMIESLSGPFANTGEAVVRNIVWAIERVNRVDRQPAIFYFHPWEIDPHQPRVRGVGAMIGPLLFAWIFSASVSAGGFPGLAWLVAAALLGIGLVVALQGRRAN